MHAPSGLEDLEPSLARCGQEVRGGPGCVCLVSWSQGMRPGKLEVDQRGLKAGRQVDN